MALVRPRYKDPFSAVLLSSPALLVTDEQKNMVREVLDVSSSDSRFSEKAYQAITRILTGGSVKVPVISSLTPNSAEVGDPSFTLHVHGTNFTSSSVIVFNGGEEVTVYVSATELTTGVNMDTVSGPVAVPIHVLSSDGVLSNAMTFTFTDGSVQSLKSVSDVKKPVVHEMKK